MAVSQPLSSPFTDALNKLIQQLPEGDPLKARFKENNKLVVKCIEILSKGGHEVAILSVQNLLTCASMFLRTYLRHSDDEELLTTLTNDLLKAVQITFDTLQLQYPHAFRELVQEHALPNAGSLSPELGQSSGVNLSQMVLDIYIGPSASEEERHTYTQQEEGMEQQNHNPEVQPLLVNSNPVEPHASPDETRRKKMKRIGGALVGVAAATGTVAVITALAVGGVALLATGVGAPAGAALISADIGIAVAVAGGVGSVATTGVAFTTGVIGGVTLHKSRKQAP